MAGLPGPNNNTTETTLTLHSQWHGFKLYMSCFPPVLSIKMLEDSTHKQISSAQVI